jgi:ferrous iron transport protein A
VDKVKKSTILDLKKGQLALVKQFVDFEATCKLLTMGLVPNAKVELIRKAPFGGALYIKLENHIIGMREVEAASVEIEIL